MTPDELAADLLTDQSDANLKILRKAIQEMPAGTSKKGINRKTILQNELLEISNSLAPVDLGLGTARQEKNIVQSTSPLDQIKDFLTNMWNGANK